VSVDHAVPHGTGVVIVRVRGLHQPTSQHFRQSRDGIVGNRCGLPVARTQLGLRHSISVQAIGRHDPAYGCRERSGRGTCTHEGCRRDPDGVHGGRAAATMPTPKEVVARVVEGRRVG
jgi:hypothetical protein